MRRKWLLVLLVSTVFLVGGVAIFGRSEPPPSGPSEPPPLALAIDGVEQQGALGTYCWWTTVRRRLLRDLARGICADAAGPVTPGKPLAAISPFTATIRLPSHEPHSLVLWVMPVSPDMELETNVTGRREWRSAGQDKQRYDLSGQAAPALDMDLEPGLYVLGASARWAQGSAAIGWLVESQPDGGI